MDDNTIPTPVDMPTPDSVHEETIRELEAEDSKDESGSDTSDNGDVNPGDAEADGDGSKSDEGTKEEVPEEKPDATDDVEEPVLPTDVKQPELNTDTLKPGEGKVAVKAFDGKTYYFNNDSEIPDDFEPASYKENMRAAKEFAIKEQRDQAAEDQRQQETVTAETQARVKTIQDGWDSDIATLTTAGNLPKDAKERQTVVDEVYTYMEGELKKGVVIDSFEQAWKAVQYDKVIAERANKQEEVNNKKKERGSLVQSGGTASSSKSIYNTAPPTGTSLDDLHAQVLGSL